MLKFLTPVAHAQGNLAWRGSANAPAATPSNLITVTSDMIGYTDLFSFVGSNYQDPMISNGDMTTHARLAYPGSYGDLYKVGRPG